MASAFNEMSGRTGVRQVGFGRLARLTAFQSVADVQIRSADQGLQGQGVNHEAGPDSHVAHVLASPLQQARGVYQRRAVEEANIHMSLEGVEISERRVLNAHDGQPSCMSSRT